jgi:hypothetical protein
MAFELPDARLDGQCVDCEKKPAVTNDKRFCIRCLRKRIREANPIVSTFSDQRGRRLRSTQVLAGQAEMCSDGDDW